MITFYHSSAKKLANFKISFHFAGQQWNSLQSEDDDTFKEAEGILQSETGEWSLAHILLKFYKYLSEVPFKSLGF